MNISDEAVAAAVRPRAWRAVQVIPDDDVEAVAKKAFQKAEGIKWDATTEHTRSKWRERYRHQMEAMARAELKKAAK